MKIYNTSTGKEQEFSCKKDIVNMYVCGPTPHAPAHVGHAKSYISFDILRRYLEWKGWKVNHIMCITDVAEEVVKKSCGDEENFARHYEDLFFRDMDRLGNLRPSISPRVSENVEGIIETISHLIEGGHGEKAGKRVILPLDKEAYGALSHVPMGEMMVEGEESLGKLDMLLWDCEAEGRKWPSPWGEGRPGWHIQCYTIIKKYMGTPVDIHGGGADLVFPHHESENIVSRILDSVDSARFWVHNGLVMAERGKMSKSLGNAPDMSSMLDEFGGAALRLFMLSKHYRENNIFSPEALGELRTVARRIFQVTSDQTGPCIEMPLGVEQAMDNDIHSEKVLDILLEELEAAEQGNSKNTKNVYAIAELLGIIDAEMV